jgi:aspartyl-tRNA(Asn)/glutamyl-tRNA(Gln) amidotransferase subunit C
MNKLSKSEVEYIAKLSRIGITKDETEKLADEISGILSYVNQLEEVETESIEITAQVMGLTNVSLEDKIVEEKISPEDLLKNAPQSLNGFIKVKPVFEQRSKL